MNRVTTQPDLAEVLRRCRQSRSARRRRQRRSALAVGLVAVALAGAGTWSIGALTGHDMVDAAVAKAHSVADLLGQRSPGERTQAQFTKTKHARALAAVHPAAKRRPHEASSPKLAMADLHKLLEAPVPIPVIAEAPTSLPAVDFSVPSIGTIISTPPGESAPGVSPPGGSPPGGSPPTIFPNSPPKAIVTVPAAVPEPGTWMTMLLGFALMGWRMRRRDTRRPVLRKA